MSKEFEAEAARLLAEFNSPGFAVEMLAGGRHLKAHMGFLAADRNHPMTPKARFATVCLIKTLIAIRVLMLAEKGDISLDAPIAEYLPELAKGPKAKGRSLKISHLLSHTGGFRSFMVNYLLPKAHESWDNCVQLLHDTDQLFEPGTVFDDEHLGHIILGQMLERLTGRHFLNVVREDVLAPLGIRPGNRVDDANHPEIYAVRHAWNTAEKKWDPEPDTYVAPDPAFGAISHLSMTSGDLLRLGQAMLAQAPAGTSAISPWIQERLFTEVVRVPRALSPVRMTRWHVAGFGLGMATFLGGHRGAVTTGRGQNSIIALDQNRQNVVALAMNTANVLEREALLNNLLAKFADDASIKPETRTLDIGFDEFLGPFSTRDIAGAYIGFRPEPVEIFATPRSFTLRLEKQEQYHFEASPENRLVMRARIATSVGLFQDPVTREPCLMMGMNAFKKVA